MNRELTTFDFTLIGISKIYQHDPILACKLFADLAMKYKTKWSVSNIHNNQILDETFIWILHPTQKKWLPFVNLTI